MFAVLLELLSQAVRALGSVYQLGAFGCGLVGFGF